MYFEEIECCSLIIFSFFNLHELCKYKTTLWNKAIQESLIEEFTAREVLPTPPLPLDIAIVLTIIKIPYFP